MSNKYKPELRENKLIIQSCVISVKGLKAWTSHWNWLVTSQTTNMEVKSAEKKISLQAVVQLLKLFIGQVKNVNWDWSSFKNKSNSSNY